MNHHVLLYWIISWIIVIGRNSSVHFNDPIFRFYHHQIRNFHFFFFFCCGDVRMPRINTLGLIPDFQFWIRRFDI
ncbi:uncharacterized protein BX664DRAFT_328346 [Halteromyces radiatus]|uniref:uncharacterized protein n=1 Tax=Halteromyces radiatus TaxID=101107 RepID=UPI002220F477|nr:uncharacterized protein BX664DRAFT_328346 [Halteromyces radiatus]KAI8092868.1 hypothetical protein BX664DRAFT_328346 [Halteromyces radiatus]